MSPVVFTIGFAGIMSGLGFLAGGYLLRAYPRFATGVSGRGDGYGAKTAAERDAMIAEYVRMKRGIGRKYQWAGLIILIGSIIVATVVWACER